MTPSPAFRPKFQALNLILADHRNEIIFLDLNKNIILVGFQEKKFQVLINWITFSTDLTVIIGLDGILVLADGKPIMPKFG